MPWKVTCAVEQRMQFIVECQKDECSMAQLCRDFQISRKTGYKWLARYRSGGIDGIKDRSRAPLAHPNAVDPEIEDRIVKLRREHGHWGARKILATLAAGDPNTPWPCLSAIGEILRRKGLSVPRRPRRRATASDRPLGQCQEPNEVWCADFKGWFRTRDGARCEPLTMTDGATRFILRCQTMSGSTGFEAVQPLFEAAFREFGLPVRIRTDNGAPFATTGLGGLSRLSVWWIRLGIRPERIRPGKPQDNGRHERMHRTLKAETAAPPRATLRAQQAAFDRFVREFNYQRPHEALGQRPPAALYEPSGRPYRRRPPPIEAYCDDWQTRKVRAGGQMKWRGKDVRVSDALAGERVGLEPVDDGLWRIYYSDIALGIFDERQGKVRPLPRARTTKSDGN